MTAVLAMTSSAIAPPPGLEAFTASPAKVEADCAHPLVMNLESTGEWANTVLTISPYLNSEGIHKALIIIDEAIKNAQQAKALEAAIAQLPRKLGCQGAPVVGSPEYMRKQVGERQRQLLMELHALPLSHGAGSAQAPATPVDPSSGLDFGIVQPAAAVDKKQVELAAQNSRQAGRQVQTLSSSLQLLSNVNPDCLFIVRRINKLGFKAARTLKKHFSTHGNVLRVLVAHSTVRQHGDPQCQARRRPSSLGFVQMASKEAVEAVLASGMEQEVDGSNIRVQKFERQHSMAEIDDELNEMRGDSKESFIWERQCSGSSSTTAPLSEFGQIQENDSQDSDGQ
jgi:hypothetical protein|mmetsp:Transcript_57507/g.168892  ORF Transcript_57507/g.168892 Transcript_57507/m.168892 type:complete len:340 (+) Transcript_57507:81-1100(+)